MAAAILAFSAGCQRQSVATRPAVSLRVVGVGEVADILTNPSDRAVVVNFWATWCPPCVAEMPDLVSLHRKFADRQVHFITVSVNKPREFQPVLKFLRQVRATTENLLVQIEGQHDFNTLTKLVGNDWSLELPATLVLSRERKQVFFVIGPFEPQELAAAINEL